MSFVVYHRIFFIFTFYNDVCHHLESEVHSKWRLLHLPQCKLCWALKLLIICSNKAKDIGVEASTLYDVCTERKLREICLQNFRDYLEEKKLQKDVVLAA